MTTIDRPPDAERPRESPGAARRSIIAGQATQGAYPQGVPALGFYLRQPSTIRARREADALVQLTLAAHAAVYRSSTPGVRLDPAEMAARLRKIAERFEAMAMGAVSEEVAA